MCVCVCVYVCALVCVWWVLRKSRIMEEGSGCDMEVWDKEEMRKGQSLKILISFYFLNPHLFKHLCILVHGELTHLLYADDEPNACSVHISWIEFPKDTSQKDKQTKTGTLPLSVNLLITNKPNWGSEEKQNRNGAMVSDSWQTLDRWLLWVDLWGGTLLQWHFGSVKAFLPASPQNVSWISRNFSNLSLRPEFSRLAHMLNFFEKS